MQYWVWDLYWCVRWGVLHVPVHHHINYHGNHGCDDRLWSSDCELCLLVFSFFLSSFKRNCPSGSPSALHWQLLFPFLHSDETCSSCSSFALEWLLLILSYPYHPSDDICSKVWWACIWCWLTATHSIMLQHKALLMSSSPCLFILLSLCRSLWF